MKHVLSLALLICGVTIQAAPEEPVYHALVTTSRTYMDATRKGKSEYWFTKDKTWISNGRVTTLVRKDLGVVYTLINSTNQYYVDSIKPAQKVVEVGKKPDFRYIGVDRLSSEYDWMVSRKPEGDTTGLFRSACYSAEGDADFDQVSLEYWLARPEVREMAKLFNAIMADNSGSQTTRKPLADRLKKNKSEVPVKIIERIDNPIAPPMLNLFILEKLEALPAPANIFELPANATKAN